MKLSFALSTIAVLLPQLVDAAATPDFQVARTHGRGRGGFGGFGGGFGGNQGTNKNGNQSQQNQGGKNSGGQTNTSVVGSTTSSVDAAATTSSAAAAATSSVAATGQPIVGGGNAQDAQTSLTLDPAVIMKGLAQDGQETPEAGQVPSLTSTNNFINFCLTQPNLPLTNGQQVTTGSCNQTPMGVIVASSKMPSAKFTNPKNGDTVAANQAFTISMAISNLETGNFVNAQANYFAAPSQVNSDGVLVGHSHVVVEQLQALDQTTPTDPTKFAFFKGLNAAAQNGVLTADVTSGLPAGFYRLASINTASNHQPALVAVAQHGSLDDAVYFTVSDNGAASNSTASTGSASSVVDTATSSVAAGAAGATGTVGVATSPVATATSTAGATGKAGAGQTGGKNTGTTRNGAGRNGGRGRRSLLARQS